MSQRGGSRASCGSCSANIILVPWQGEQLKRLSPLPPQTNFLAKDGRSNCPNLIIAGHSSSHALSSETCSRCLVRACVFARFVADKVTDSKRCHAREQPTVLL